MNALVFVRARIRVYLICAVEMQRLQSAQTQVHFSRHFLIFPSPSSPPPSTVAVTGHVGTIRARPSRRHPSRTTTRHRGAALSVSFFFSLVRRPSQMPFLLLLLLFAPPRSPPPRVNSLFIRVFSHYVWRARIYFHSVASFLKDFPDLSRSPRVINFSLIVYRCAPPPSASFGIVDCLYEF